MGLSRILPEERGNGIVTQPKQRQEATRRTDRKPARSHQERVAADFRDNYFWPPNAEKFHITDLQLWIDLSA